MFEKKFGNRVEPSIHGTPRGTTRGTTRETPYATPRGSPHGTPSRIPIRISPKRSSCNDSDVILRETTLTKIKITSSETTIQGTSLRTPELESCETSDEKSW